MPPLMHDLVLVAAAAAIVHVISRRSWKDGCTYGRETTKKLTEQEEKMLVLRGMAQIRLNDARGVDLITELRNMPGR